MHACYRDCMAQLTVRMNEELAKQLKERAAADRRSVNAWVVAVIRAAVDPDFAGSDAERTRERLRRAGLLADPDPYPPPEAPDEARLRKARREAGKGTPLSELVSADRD